MFRQSHYSYQEPSFVLHGQDHDECHQVKSHQGNDLRLWVLRRLHVHCLGGEEQVGETEKQVGQTEKQVGETGKRGQTEEVGQTEQLGHMKKCGWRDQPRRMEQLGHNHQLDRMEKRGHKDQHCGKEPPGRKDQRRGDKEKSGRKEHQEKSGRKEHKKKSGRKEQNHDVAACWEGARALQTPSGGRGFGGLKLPQRLDQLPSGGREARHAP